MTIPIYCFQDLEWPKYFQAFFFFFNFNRILDFIIEYNSISSKNYLTFQKTFVKEN